MIIEAKADLIFLDLIMPIANGYEICTQLRRAVIFENTPIIILTGSDKVVDWVRAKMVGATGYITKPIEPKKSIRISKTIFTKSSISWFSNQTEWIRFLME